VNQREVTDVQQWIERPNEVKMEFDYTIVNDDLEVAYQQLKSYCLEKYWQDFEKDE
jgi:guanylate kinase